MPLFSKPKFVCLFVIATAMLQNVQRSAGQTAVNLQEFNKKSGVSVRVNGSKINLSWPVGNAEHGRVVFDLDKTKPLFKSIQATRKELYKEVAANLNPEFILTVGKRDLVSQNGWNIFFDRVPQKPFTPYLVGFDKQTASVKTEGSRTIVRIDGVKASTFSGQLEITFYNGSPLFNVAAVMATDADSTAIVYDAGLVSTIAAWSKISWAKTNDEFSGAPFSAADTSKNIAVKYRTIIGQTTNGSLAIFPAPHQYFYPLDEAFNLKFTWYGTNYRKMIPGYGIGIRQDLYGDHRYVPWFNAPPGTQQRLNFFCLVSTGDGRSTLEKIKQFTHSDRFVPLPGYKTMSSHFHNEYTTTVLLKGKPVEAEPEYVRVFKNLGVNIVHLAEFHGTGHPKGPDELRLKELNTLFKECEKESGKNFLLLPGEEPNEFFGGHWLEFFPKPIYWVMSRREGVPFVADDSRYGKVYHIRDKDDMLKLLETENGLAWTAHARTKGSTGYPDLYKNEAFYNSDHFNGAAWKNIPADLSTERMGKRVFDLMDDMNNWGLKKKVLAESDIFTITRDNEMYAHVNVNYLKMAALPEFKNGWQPVLDVLKSGNFFSTTGEVLIPTFKVNGAEAGSTIKITGDNRSAVDFSVKWTFPLNFVELITGDGRNIFREKIDLAYTTAFGSQSFHIPVNLKGKKWIRLEVWDAAVNGAFTQTVWLE
ncbi:hypothetical protein [Mucilaginibacter sp. UR6-11]|uniref:hypothetical protein n=1 Tax=Mucilaginibacter sp. UR6-11 TaxID=1435644 RepID=UPI001E3B2223|nr:hypothetical protein [Mucilaginibacter sp. UR6-11]MCC8424638.1 hypothetical protein [Mucilaginibacter sp. UR6-11]